MQQPNENKVNFISLSNLTGRISRTLQQHMGESYWVVAQISEAKLNYSGHYYMELSEYKQGQALPLAVVRAVIWSRTYRMIAPYFRQSTGMDLGVGVQVLLRCSVSFHDVYGFSLVVEDVDPSYTLGVEQMIRQQTIDRLTREGVVDMNHQHTLGDIIQRVALISSATAAGYEDFMNELLSSGYKFDVDLYHATMQGVGAVQSIIEALERVAMSEHAEDYDAVIILRGGGSRGDLSCFDDYDLAANVAQFPLPVITGIGHERDVSAVDMVACMSLKTPTAVAAMLVARVHDFMSDLQDMETSIVSRARTVIAQGEWWLERCYAQLQRSGDGIVNQHMNALQGMEHRLKTMAIGVVDGRRRLLDKYLSELYLNSHRKIQRESSSLELAVLRLTHDSRKIIIINDQSLREAQLKVEGADPRGILSRGYALVRREDGRGGRLALKSVNEVSCGQELVVELSDGVVSAVIDKIIRN